MNKKEIIKKNLLNFFRKRPIIYFTGFIFYLRLLNYNHSLIKLDINKIFILKSVKRKSISQLSLLRVKHNLENFRKILNLYKSSNKVDKYNKLLDWLEGMGHLFASDGNQTLAAMCLTEVSNFIDQNSSRGIDNLKNLAIIQFMIGDLSASRVTFKKLSYVNEIRRRKSRAQVNFKFLDQSWFVAIGHVAMIDILIKQVKLGWLDGTDILVIENDKLDNLAGKTILKKLSHENIEFTNNLSLYYDLNKGLEDPIWSDLSNDEKSSLFIDFWSYNISRYPEINFFSDGAARIQLEWESQAKPPLIKLDIDEERDLSDLLYQLNLPKNSWYVCLHVRESGFHGDWNKKYPSARDANADDYILAAEEIINKGGFVIRMGDPTMSPFKKMDGVIDYAHSNFKSEVNDTLLSAGCRFMLGTNSGFSILPATFGRPCALTNWIPLAIPNWYSKDLFIPKLLWDSTKNRYLKISEILSSSLGTLQNVHDFPETIQIHDNEPEEIHAITSEMIGILSNEYDKGKDYEILNLKFKNIMQSYGNIMNCDVSSFWIRKYNFLID
jgi:putative glycosyltransferase (TIGR04372 family)